MGVEFFYVAVDDLLVFGWLQFVGGNELLYVVGGVFWVVVGWCE